MNFKATLDKNGLFGQVGEAASVLGLDTYVVGGYVRDLLLDRPCKDLDFVCVGSGIMLAEEVARQLGGLKLTVFKNFGTARVDWKGYALEFVGARKESYRYDSRKPIVEDGTLQDDQGRRDFTINTMAISLNENTWGELVDPFNGIEELKRRNIRTPVAPEITFSDDPLRMMRAVRFATQLNFDIEPETYQAIVAQSHRLKIVSIERIVEELNKIIMAPVPSYGFKLLFHSGLLNVFFPEMVALQGVETVDKKGHKDNFYHTLQVLDNVATVSDDLWLRWAAILHDIAKPLTKRFDKNLGWTFHGHEDKGARMVPGLFRRLKLPMNEKMEFVKKLVRLHLRPIALAKEVTDSAIRRLLFEAGEDTEALMMLCRADITSKNNEKVARYLKNFDEVEKRMVEVEGKDKVRQFQPPISGDEIIKIFGIAPGRLVGQLKDQIKEAILEGEIENNKAQAYQLLLSLARKHNLAPVEMKNY